MKPTQNARILAALKRGAVLTMLDGYRIARTLNLHKRIAEIDTQLYLQSGRKAVGFIERVWVKRNGRRLRAWKLA